MYNEGKCYRHSDGGEMILGWGWYMALERKWDASRKDGGIYRGRKFELCEHT